MPLASIVTWPHLTARKPGKCSLALWPGGWGRQYLMGSALHAFRVPHNLAPVYISNLTSHNSPLTCHLSFCLLSVSWTPKPKTPKLISASELLYWLLVWPLTGWFFPSCSPSFGDHILHPMRPQPPPSVPSPLPDFYFLYSILHYLKLYYLFAYLLSFPY